MGTDNIGIIPADAGSTVRSNRKPPERPGSSPRMRGAPSALVRALSADGIIPADAGSTFVIMKVAETD